MNNLERLEELADRITRTEAEKQSSLKLYQHVFDTSPWGIILVNSIGDIVRINERAENMFGYNAGELIGHPINVLVPVPHKESHPALVRGFIASSNTVLNRDVVGCRKDGTIIELRLKVTSIEFGNGIGAAAMASVIDT